MGYVPPPEPFRQNLDRFGMPRDYATYVWLLYGRRIEDKSPARRAFLDGPTTANSLPDFGMQLSMR